MADGTYTLRKNRYFECIPLPDILSARGDKNDRNFTKQPSPSLSGALNGTINKPASLQSITVLISIGVMPFGAPGKNVNQMPNNQNMYDIIEKLKECV